LFTLEREALPGGKTLEVEENHRSFPGQKVSTLEFSAGEKYFSQIFVYLEFKSPPTPCPSSLFVLKTKKLFPGVTQWF
jgi:hypothetical protein